MVLGTVFAKGLLVILKLALFNLIALKDVPGNKFTLLATLSQDQTQTNTTFNVDLIYDTDVSII